MMSKPREFWLQELKDYDQWSAHDHEQYDDDVHVIEFSAYATILKELCTLRVEAEEHEKEIIEVANVAFLQGLAKGRTKPAE